MVATLKTGTRCGIAIWDALSPGKPTYVGIETKPPKS